MPTIAQRVQLPIISHHIQWAVYEFPGKFLATCIDLSSPVFFHSTNQFWRIFFVNPVCHSVPSSRLGKTFGSEGTRYGPSASLPPPTGDRRPPRGPDGQIARRSTGGTPRSAPRPSPMGTLAHPSPAHPRQKGEGGGPSGEAGRPPVDFPAIRLSGLGDRPLGVVAS